MKTKNKPEKHNTPKWYKGGHYCEKEYPRPYKMYGGAINRCWEDEEGRFWVDNGEYCSQVNFCPYTGTRAPKLIEE